MTDESLTRPMFSVSTASDAPHGSLDLWIDFVEEIDARRLTLWSASLQRTFSLLTLAGGTGGAVIHPAQAATRIVDHASVVVDGRTLARWSFEPTRFDPAALRILRNLIQHNTFCIGEGDAVIGSPVAEVIFDSKDFAHLSIDTLPFPAQWPQLPYVIEDYEPETTDFDIEIEFRGPPGKQVMAQYRTLVSTWLTTVERGGFLGHPLQSWKFGFDTSEEPFSEAPGSLFIRLRDFYSHYEALDSLFNVLVRAHELHPIAVVHLGE